MKHEFNSRRLFGITRSKGKMYELGVPVESHIAIPPKTHPEELFLSTIATLGDVAASINDSEDLSNPVSSDLAEELNFSANFFDAYIQAKFTESINAEVSLLASAAYYLSKRPGSSLVIARKLNKEDELSDIGKVLLWLLKGEWRSYPEIDHPYFGNHLKNIPKFLAHHFYDGSGADELNREIQDIRKKAYKSGSSY